MKASLAQLEAGVEAYEEAGNEGIEGVSGVAGVWRRGLPGGGSGGAGGGEWRLSLSEGSLAITTSSSALIAFIA